jgi:hypothetical protein
MSERPMQRLAATTTTHEFQAQLKSFWTRRCKEILQERSSLQRDDLEYIAEVSSKLKDERLKACIATLIGWGDDERAEMETFCAIALEVMGMSSPSKLREATLRVELRFYMEKQRNDKN